MEYHNKEQVVEFLSGIGDERAYEYELELTAFVINQIGDNVGDMLAEILHGDETEDVRYAAFYALNILHRRRNDFLEMQKLLQSHRDEFTDHSTYNHLWILYCIESEIIYDYHELLSLSYQDALDFDDNAGFVHVFPALFASIYERGVIEDEESFLNKWLQEAKKAAQRSVEINPSYAKYYCTLGRIMAIEGNYPQARGYINKAIAIEDSSKDDYLMRLSLYQYYKIMVDVKRQLAKRPSKISDRLRKEAAKMAELQNAYTGNDPYVFVSYDHEDSPRVYPIVSNLQKLGVRIWIDHNGIKGNADYSDYIADRIVCCTTFIFMVSGTSVEKEFVRKEVNMAINRCKKPLCVFIEDTCLPGGLEIHLAMYQHIHLDPDNPEGNAKMIFKELPSEVKETGESL